MCELWPWLLPMGLLIGLAVVPDVVGDTTMTLMLPFLMVFPAKEILSPPPTQAQTPTPTARPVSTPARARPPEPPGPTPGPDDDPDVEVYQHHDPDPSTDTDHHRVGRVGVITVRRRSYNLIA